MTLLVVDVYLDVGLVWLCGPSWDHFRLLTWCPALAWSHVGEAFLPIWHPSSGVKFLQGPQRGPSLLPLGSPTSHWEDWSFVTMHFFSCELATLPLLSNSAWVQVHLFSRACSFSARNWQGDFKTYILSFLFFFHTTPRLVLNTYMSCCEYVCEWIGQDSNFELQEISFVLQCTWLNVRRGTDKDLAILRVSLERHLT